MFLKQGLSAQLTSKRTLDGDVIPSAQFAAATLQTIFWTHTAKMLRRFCKTSREVLLGSTCSSRYGSNASGPVVGTVLGAGQPRGGPYGRCRGAAARPATLRAAICSLDARKLALSQRLIAD